MFCPQCGSQIEVGSSFCSSCRARVPGSASEVVSVQKKPIGLVLIVIYTAFSGVLSLLVGTLFLFVSGLPVPIWAPLLGILLTLVGVLDIAACYGLWTTQKWGLTLAIVLYIVSIPVSILAVFIGEVTAGSILLTVVGILIAIMILKYLLKPDVKALFR